MTLSCLLCFFLKILLFVLSSMVMPTTMKVVLRSTTVASGAQFVDINGTSAMVMSSVSSSVIKEQHGFGLITTLVEEQDKCGCTMSTAWEMRQAWQSVIIQVGEEDTAVGIGTQLVYPALQVSTVSASDLKPR